MRKALVILFIMVTAANQVHANGPLKDTAWELVSMKCENKGTDINPRGLNWKFYFVGDSVFKQTLTVQRPDYNNGKKCVGKSTGIYSLNDNKVILDLNSIDPGYSDCGAGGQDLEPYLWVLESVDDKQLVLVRNQDDQFGTECSKSKDMVYAVFKALGGSEPDENDVGGNSNTVQCDIGKVASSPEKSIQFDIVTGIFPEGNPNKSEASLGDFKVILTSNWNKIYLTVVDKTKTGDAAYIFSKGYMNMDGSKQSGGFTGEINLNSGVPNKQIGFKCYRL